MHLFCSNIHKWIGIISQSLKIKSGPLNPKVIVGSKKRWQMLIYCSAWKLAKTPINSIMTQKLRYFIQIKRHCFGWRVWLLEGNNLYGRGHRSLMTPLGMRVHETGSLATGRVNFGHTIKRATTHKEPPTQRGIAALLC